jgi:predicted transposase YdaD
MDEINHPHDVDFRERFTRREIAQDFLRWRLPAELLEFVDLDSLEISKESDVSKALRASYSDLVYQLRPCGPDQPVTSAELEPVSASTSAPAPDLALCVYMLFEHKSTPDYWIALQLLTRLVQLAMRWIFSQEPLEHLERLIALIDQIADRDTALEILESLLRYYVQGTQRVAEDDARHLLEQTSPGDPIMQTFIDRYIEQGMELGREQGMEQGERQGEAKLLLRQMERKFGPTDAQLRQQIQEADAETLLEWSDRILTAETPEGVFH